MKVVGTVKQILEKAMSKTHFTEDMQDMGGEWYGGAYEIEPDLGCSLELYDWMQSSLYYLNELSEMGKNEITFSIKDTYFFEQAYRMAEAVKMMRKQ